MNFWENLDRTQLIHLGVEYGVPLLKALAILIVGWVVAKLLSKGASKVGGYVVLTVILFIGTVQAFNTLDLEIVSNLANELLQGLFSILVAGIIFAVGLFLSNLAAKAISASGQEHAKTLASVARVAILIFTGAMALYRTDLAPEIVNHAFTALIFGLAAAGALAFGLGGRDAASRAIEGWKGEQE